MSAHKVNEPQTKVRRGAISFKIFCCLGNRFQNDVICLKPVA